LRFFHRSLFSCPTSLAIQLTSCLFPSDPYLPPLFDSTPPNWICCCVAVACRVSFPSALSEQAKFPRSRCSPDVFFFLSPTPLIFLSMIAFFSDQSGHRLSSPCGGDADCTAMGVKRMSSPCPLPSLNEKASLDGSSPPPPPPPPPRPPPPFFPHLFCWLPDDMSAAGKSLRHSFVEPSVPPSFGPRMRALCVTSSLLFFADLLFLWHFNDFTRGSGAFCLFLCDR